MRMHSSQQPGIDDLESSRGPEQQIAEPHIAVECLCSFESVQSFEGLSSDLLDDIGRESPTSHEQFIERLAAGQRADRDERFCVFFPRSRQTQVAMRQLLYSSQVALKAWTRPVRMRHLQWKYGDRYRFAARQRLGPIPHRPAIMRQPIDQHVRPDLQRVGTLSEALGLKWSQDFALHQGVNPHRIKGGQIAHQVADVFLARAEILRRR